MYRLQNLCGGLAQGIRRAHFLLGNESKQAYILISKIVLQGLNIATFPEIQRNPLLAQIGTEIQMLIKETDKLLDAHLTESTALLYTSMRAIEQAKPSYIILCDCLSLSEFLFLIHMFRESVRNDRVLCAANPSGMTSTFKYLARDYLNIPVPPEDIIMRTVGTELRRRLAAHNCTLFRDFDNLVHHGKSSPDIETLLIDLSEISHRLYSKTYSLVKTERRVLLLADHGYDFILDNGEWKLYHGWSIDKLCMSPFVPILILEAV